ncbi:MAG: family transcriptional regulator, cyclic receptor protein [Solirubrobacteraceae bacterium]|nr:Crp/Fnr family transcriptional regulator [Solirubrobacterales bacterium]MEA2215273.1 family transcriptional regulator, cyclic receptor protein [Solirubrobacteraceae bacterium]
MSVDGPENAESGPSSRFTRRAAGEPASALGSVALYAYVLDADDELAQDLPLSDRLRARQHVTARVLQAEPGESALGRWLTTIGRGPGLLILDGLLAADTRVADRTITELLGSGDLVQPPSRHTDDLIERIESWRALSPCRLALLDGEFADRVLPWPPIARALLRRAERRAEDLGVLRAISCEPRLEIRLVLLLFHLATRWGRVEPGGIHLTMPLTHRLLGQLVAAERPSVSNALGRLAGAGLVTGAADDLHLHGDLGGQLRSLARPRAPLEHARPVRPAERRRA